MRIEAEDDLGLVGLNVSIIAQDGTPIESSNAVEKGVRSGEWIYTITKPVALGTDVLLRSKVSITLGTKRNYQKPQGGDARVT